jgi:hypothetical protein
MRLFPLFLFIATVWVSSPAFAAKPAQKRTNADLSGLPPPLTRPIRYFGDIHPILAEHCVSCHGPDKQKGSLRLDSRDAALAGGGSYGPAIVPGNPAESPLLLFTAHFEPDMEMPPDGDKLGDLQIALLRTWIEQGAPWPTKGNSAEGGETLGNQELYFKKAATHWAFQAIPKASADDLKQVPQRIDQLILSELEKNQLKPSPPADPRTLLRRLHFDTTGWTSPATPTPATSSPRPISATRSRGRIATTWSAPSIKANRMISSCLSKSPPTTSTSQLRTPTSQRSVSSPSVRASVAAPMK